MIAFTKVHGCGNDFILIDLRSGAPEFLKHGLQPKTAASLCNRRTGIGADGILIIHTSANILFARITNADGTDGGMCGNGLRCIARYLHHLGELTENHWRTIRMGGRDTRICVRSDSPFSCSVDLGSVLLCSRSVLSGEPHDHCADLESASSIDIDGYKPHLVWAGNPHAVVFVDADPSREMLQAISSKLRKSNQFKRGVNVSTAQSLGTNRIRAMTDERGVGPTLACASGACAIAVAARDLGLVESTACIDMPGGDLEVQVTVGTGSAARYHVLLTASADIVFTGTIDTRTFVSEP